MGSTREGGPPEWKEDQSGSLYKERVNVGDRMERTVQVGDRPQRQGVDDRMDRNGQASDSGTVSGKKVRACASMGQRYVAGTDLEV